MSDHAVTPAETEPSEELRFTYAGFENDKEELHLTFSAMFQRLPQLVRRSFALAWKVDRASVVALLSCQLLSGVSGAFGLFATTGTITALISDGHMAARLQQAAPAVAVLAGAAGLRALLGIAISGLSNRLSPRIAREAEYMMLEAATGAELAAYDHPGFNDRWDLADRGVEACRELIGETQNLVSSLASLVAAALVICVLHPALLPLLALAAIPQGVASIRASGVTYLAAIANIQDLRLMSMLRWHLIDKGQADQVRSDTISPYLLGRYRSAARRADATNDRAVLRTARITLVGALLSGAASGLVWAALALLLATGHISVARAGTAVLALGAAATSLKGIVGYGAQLFRTGLYLDDWSAFVTEAGDMRLNRGGIRPERPKLIQLRDVVFSYPEADEATLRGVDLELRRGEIVAVIGENGSGKSTLMKLLCGLNLPTEGAVLWDGVDTRELDPHALWRHVSVVPQEFARWPLTFRENVHLGQPRSDGDELVHEAARASSADDVVATLRSGMDTLLAREWWGGVALSSGQWQRIAVARAVHRDAGLMVLDEPTSDLDPRAEHRIFTGLRRLARDRAIVLVTHNLANAAVADRIVVLERGRVSQCGSFDELSASPGLFRELWQLRNDRPAPGPE